MIEQLKSKEVFVRWAVFAFLLIAFVFINFPFLMTLAVAGVFALGLQNFINSLVRRTGGRRRWWILITVFCGIGVFLIPLSLAIYRAGAWVMSPQNFESKKLFTQLNSVKEFAISGLDKISDWTGTDVATPARETLETLLHKTGEMILGFSTQFAGQLPAILLALFVFVIATTVMLFKDQNIRDFVIDYSIFNAELTEKMISILKTSCSVTLFSTFVIGLIQASIIGMGSLIFGEGDFWLVITVTFFVSFIPVIGAAPVGYLLALLAFLGDRTGAGIGLAFIATVAGSIDNILKPFMVSGDFKVNAVIGFTCVVGAIIMLGLPGLLLGPVIMNLFVGISPLLLKNREP